jgi:hypothetical protein
MTPNAITPAARGGSTASREKPKSRPAGHRARLRKQTVPRRVSGPAGGAGQARAASSTGSAGSARARPAPSTTRRRRSARPAPAPTAGGALLTRSRAFVASLPDSPLLDRLVRGRYWIPLLGVLLAGIVAMQVEVLKLSAGVGRSIERSTALQSRNEQLRASVASLSGDQRIERIAASMGMVMPAPEAIDFLGLPPRAAVRKAVTNIHAPDAANFIATLPLIDTPNGAAAGASTDGVTATPGVTASPGVTTTGVTANAGVTVTPTTTTPAATTTPVAPAAGPSATTGG